MSDKPPALPAPQQGDAPAPAPNRGRRFEPRFQGRYRKDGMSEGDALREMQRRREAGQPSGGDPLFGRRPAAELAPRPETPAPPRVVDTGRPFTPLTGVIDAPDAITLPPGAAQPAPPMAPDHPLAPAPGPVGDPVFDLTVGGAPQRVALSELIRGYMRNADYTAKTQAAAAQLQQAQTAHAAFENARKNLESRLPNVIASLSDEFAAPIDWVKLAQTDPIGYAQKDARHKAFQAAQAEQANLVQLRAREDALRKQEMQRLGHEFLMQVLPGWRDPTTRQQLQSLQIAHLRDVGYSQPEIDNYELLDPRQVIILEESRRFRALVAAHPELLRTPEMRPQPPTRRGMPGSMAGQGRQPVPDVPGARGAQSQQEVERRWEEMEDRTGRRARETAVDLIGARRRAAQGSTAPLRPTRGGR